VLSGESVNLPNVVTLTRIAAAPFIAALPFFPNATPRIAAFVLYIAAAITDYVDGYLARNRNLVTRVGKLLDPLADKVLLLATLTPMFVLMSSRDDLVARSLWSFNGAFSFPFLTPLGTISLSWWIVAVVLGRELFMTVFRQVASRRGVAIAAIGPAKWKTVAQYIWVGAAYFWIFSATLAAERGWAGKVWQAFAMFNGSVGVLTMAIAVLLTLYSLGLYLRRYGSLLIRQPVSH
jgi:CDP-diacylglycerol---glycerol-3-phosphate 3-phosphatidyltransferase